MARRARSRVPVLPAVAAGAGAVLLVVGVVGVGSAPAQPRRSEHVHQRLFEVPAIDGPPQRVLVTFPRRSDARELPADERIPVVVALHGRGEAARGPDRGFLGWNVDYQLPQAFGALARGRLWGVDYRALVTDRHLEHVNASLEVEPFRGVCVVTPYTPDLLTEQPGSERIRAWGDWVSGPLLERIREELPVARGRTGTGIDGVSLGGMLALEVGLAHPDAYGAVGAIQPAIRGRVEHIAGLARRARAQGDPPHLRLLTSEDDPFLAPTRRLSERLREARYPHDRIVLPGPHDYVFNRGPGAIELLRFHDRVLAREPP